jgi:hypothetical protein
LAAGPRLAGAWDRSCVWGRAQDLPSVRRSRQSRPEPRRRRGARGAAPEVPGSQPPANSEFFRHELGRASVSAPAHPLLPAWVPPPPSRVGGTARPARTPGPLSALLVGHTHPTPPQSWSGQERALWVCGGGPGWGALPPAMPAPPGLARPFAGSCSCPPSQGRAGEWGKARRAWTGQSSTPVPAGKVTQAPSPAGKGCSLSQGHLATD